MLRSISFAVLLGSLVFTGYAFSPRLSNGDEQEAILDQVNALRQKAAALAEQGDKKLAAQLNQEADQLIENAKRGETAPQKKGKPVAKPEIDKGKESQRIEKQSQGLKEQLHKLRERLQQLTAAGGPEPEIDEVRRQVVQTETELQKISSGQAFLMIRRHDLQPHAARLELASRRIQNIRIAAENLKLADEHEIAQGLLKKAEAMERDVEESKRQLAREAMTGHEQRPEIPPEVIHDLKQEIERLRSEIRELRQQVTPR